MGAVNKVFQSAIDLIAEGVQSLGFLKNAFSDPIGTIKQLGDMIGNNLLNRFKALGGFVEAISLAFQGQWAKAAQTATNAALQLGTGVQGLGTRFSAAAKEGYNAEAALDALKDKMGEAEIAIEKNNIAIEGYRETMMNTTKSEGERRKAAEQLIKLETENANKRKQIAQLELDAEREKTKGIVLSGEQRLAISRLEVNVLKAETDRKAAIRKAEIEIDKLFNKEKKDEAKKSADEIKSTEDDLAKFRIGLQEETLQKQFALFEIDNKKKAEELRKMGATEEEIAKYTAEQKLKVEQDYYNKLITIEQQKLAAKKKAADEEKAFNNTIKQNREYDAKIMQEFRISQAQMDAEFAAGEYENSKALYDAKKALKDKELADSKKKAEEEAAINQAVFDSSSQLVNALAQISTVALGNSAAGVAFQKVLAGVQIAIDTATAISSIVTGIMKVVGTNPSPLAIFQVVAQVATGIAVVTTNMMKATQLLSSANTPEAPEMQTFAEGGRVYTLGGKRHSEGGTKFYGSDGTRFEAERGEKIFVMKRTASSAIDRLGSFNQLYGGRPWSSTRHAHAEDGGLVFDGGMTSRSFNQPNITEQLRNALTNMPPAVVSVKEINTVNTRRTIAQEQAGL